MPIFADLNQKVWIMQDLIKVCRAEKGIEIDRYAYTFIRYSIVQVSLIVIK